jgi:hypothetical protein
VTNTVTGIQHFTCDLRAYVLSIGRGLFESVFAFFFGPEIVPEIQLAPVVWSYFSSNSLISQLLSLLLDVLIFIAQYYSFDTANYS